MALAEEAVKHLKGKQVVVVTSVQSESYLQEIVGTLLEGVDGCLVVQQETDSSPTIINAAIVAWVYEATGEEEEGNE